MKTRIARAAAAMMAVFALALGAGAAAEPPTTHPAADTGWP
jgi:hypothetical protein